MSTLEQRCLIHTNMETAFQATQDYSLRSHWDPFTKTIERTADGQVLVKAWHGMSTQVEYVSWHPPMRAAIRMVHGPRMLERFAGTWSFTEHSPGIIEVRFRYTMRAARHWRWLEPLMLRYLKIETRRRLNALKHYLNPADIHIDKSCG